MGVKGVAILAISFFVSACGMDSQGVMEVMSAAATPIDYSNPGAAFASGLQRGINISDAVIRARDREEARNRAEEDSHPSALSFVHDFSLYAAQRLGGELLQSLPFSPEYKGKNIVKYAQLLTDIPWKVAAIDDYSIVIANSIAKLPNNRRGAIDVYFDQNEDDMVLTYAVYSCDEHTIDPIYRAITYKHSLIIKDHYTPDQRIMYTKKGTVGRYSVELICNTVIYSRDGSGNNYMSKTR